MKHSLFKIIIFVNKIDLIITHIFNIMNAQNTMLSSDEFKCLNLPIPDMVYKYSLETQKEIFEYLKNMDAHHTTAYLIAVSLLLYVLF